MLPVLHQMEAFAQAMELINEVLKEKKTIYDLRQWYANFGMVFSSDYLTTEEYQIHFLRGSTDGFLEILPKAQRDTIQRVNENFWKDKIELMFFFLPKELAEEAAWAQGFKLGIKAGMIYNQRHKGN